MALWVATRGAAVLHAQRLFSNACLPSAARVEAPYGPSQEHGVTGAWRSRMGSFLSGISCTPVPHAWQARVLTQPNCPAGSRAPALPVTRRRGPRKPPQILPEPSPVAAGHTSQHHPACCEPAHALCPRGGPGGLLGCHSAPGVAPVATCGRSGCSPCSAAARLGGSFRKRRSC